KACYRPATAPGRARSTAGRASPAIWRAAAPRASPTIVPGRAGAASAAFPAGAPCARRHRQAPPDGVEIGAEIGVEIGGRGSKGGETMDQGNARTSQAARAPLGAKDHGEPIQVFFSPPGTPRRPRAVRGEGPYIWDDSGRRYLDVSSGPVANNLGHGNERVLRAMERQARAIAFAFPGQFESEANEALADLVTGLAGPGHERAFFVSGGSEATESALRFARKHAVVTGQ